MTWPTIRLGEVIRQRKEFITIDDTAMYRRPRVQLHTQGVVLRDQVPGALIKTKSQQICRQGEFLVAEIDAKVGGYGLVTPELDGAIVSSHYFLFQANAARLDYRFLGWFAKTRAFHAQVEAQGSTNYAAIRPSDVLDYQIPLPSLQEQVRVISLIETVARQIADAQVLRREATEDSEQLCRAIIHSDKAAKPMRMRELVRLKTPDVIVRPDETYQFAGVYSFGRGVFKSERRSGLEFQYQRLSRLKTNNFVYPKLMAWEGALGVVPSDCDGCVVSPEFPVFEIIDDQVAPQVLDTYFRNPSVWPKISGASTGTNVRRRRLNPQAFLDYIMPLPSPEVQRRLCAIRSEMASIASDRESTVAELAALLPAVIDRAFQGGFSRSL